MTDPCRVQAPLLLFAAAIMLSGCLAKSSVQIPAEQQKINDLNERALSLAEKGYDVEAGKLLQQALYQASSLDDREGQVSTLLNQSRLARHANKTGLAEQYLERALLLAARTGLYADAAQEKALQELAAGRYVQAASWAETARTAEQGDLGGRRLNLLARIALVKGDKAEAARQAELALSENSRDGMEQERANSLRILGLVKAQAGQYETAEKMLQEALQLDKEQAVPSGIAADLDALAELAGLKKDPHRQQDYRNRAKSVRENSQPSKKLP